MHNHPQFKKLCAKWKILRESTEGSPILGDYSIIKMYQISKILKKCLNSSYMQLACNFHVIWCE